MAIAGFIRKTPTAPVVTTIDKVALASIAVVLESGRCVVFDSIIFIIHFHQIQKYGNPVSVVGVGQTSSHGE
ncbi:hypothetical protein H6F76_04500 [Leptolyngbya sp. FACHB-321]|uniref:hypothetical protein n=1 Tax=Leptolyngbya sp. FACHB-321 TaxID=2692807 RepID=UPI00168554E0|nr:hypothetical protein [Leptolyngbya sp. FACHB-321]MBD2034299.1 hypothetical protein [Leptolyngbya sp. FACHB-321]